MTKRYTVRVALACGGYAMLEHRGYNAWERRTALRLAREYKADNLRDAWIEEAEGYETWRGKQA